MNSERLKEGFLKLCEALNKEGVKYVVIGGFILHLYRPFHRPISRKYFKIKKR
jgi:hypothetical protein